MIHFFLISIGYLLSILTCFSIFLITDSDIQGFAFGIVFGYTSAAPFALIFISISEIYKIRKISYYTIFGVLFALFVIFTVGLNINEKSEFVLFKHLFFIFSVTVSVFVYWAIAGRQAGVWIHETTGEFFKNILSYIACIFFTSLALMLPVVLFFIWGMYRHAGIL